MDTSNIPIHNVVISMRVNLKRGRNRVWADRRQININMKECLKVIEKKGMVK